MCACLVNSVPSSRTPCCLPQLKESIFKEADSSNTITWRDQVLRAKQPGRCSTSASIQLTPIWHNIAMFVVAQGCRPILLVCHDWSIARIIRKSDLKVYQWFLSWQSEFLVINVEMRHLIFLWKLTYPPPKNNNLINRKKNSIYLKKKSLYLFSFLKNKSEIRRKKTEHDTQSTFLCKFVQKCKVWPNHFCEQGQVINWTDPTGGKLCINKFYCINYAL